MMQVRRLKLFAMVFNLGVKFRRRSRSLYVQRHDKARVLLPITTCLLASRLAGVDSLFIGPSYAAPAVCGAFASASANH